jgi:protein SCO1
MKRWQLPVILCLIAALLGVLVATQWHRPATLQQAVWLDTPRALPAIDIVNADGETMPLNQPTGEWRLVFPGFTYCPDICPDTLSRLAQMAPTLAPVTVTLFSIDPERDTPERLREYVRYFDPSFNAITPASLDDLPAMALALSVAYAKAPLEGDTYTMDHSTAMPLIDPDGRLVAFFTELNDPAVFAADLQHILESVNDGKRPRS